MLSASNIRFLLQLVEFSLVEHIGQNKSLNEPVGALEQTKAARAVGRANLKELEGVDVEGRPEGGRIVALLMGLGRLFEIFAREPFGHAPEVNQFYVDEPEADHAETIPLEQVDRLLKASVTHLALVRTAANKLGREDPRAFDHAIHPIFSPLFQFSHRKKRKTKLSVEELHGLINNSRETFDQVLNRHNRGEEQNDQLYLF